MKNSLKLLLTAAIVFTAGSSSAVEKTWGGGTGEWNTTDSNWSASAWDNSAAPYDSALFSGTAGTVTVNGTMNVSGLRFTATGYTLSGGSLNFGDTQGVIDSSAAGNPTKLYSSLTGTVGVTVRSGSGIFVIGGNNSGLSGGITITAGNVFINTAKNANAAGVGTVTLNGGTLVAPNKLTDYDNANADFVLTNDVAVGAAGGTIITWGSTSSTFNGTLSGSGALTINDGGQVYFTKKAANAAAAYTGTVTINGGTTHLTSGAQFPGAEGNALGLGEVIVNSGAKLKADAALCLDNRTNSTRVVTLNSGTLETTGREYLGTLNMTGTAMVLLSRTGSADPLNIGTINVTGAGTNAIIKENTGANGQMGFNGVSTTAMVGTGATLTISTVINTEGGNTRTLTKTGAGTMILTAANTFAGATNVTGGTLQIASTGSLNSSAVTVSGAAKVINSGSMKSAAMGAGTTLQLDGGTVTTLTNTGAFTLSGSGGNITNAPTLSDATFTNTGTITFGGNLTLSGNVTINHAAGVLLAGSGGTLAFGPGATLALTGLDSGVTYAMSDLFGADWANSAVSLQTLLTDTTVTVNGLAVQYDVSGNITAVPEPSTYALIAGVVALGVAVAVRRRKAR